MPKDPADTASRKTKPLLVGHNVIALAGMVPSREGSVICEKTFRCGGRPKGLSDDAWTFGI